MTLPQLQSQQLRHWVVGLPRFVFALLLAVGVATLLTTVSVWIYNSSDVSGIDLSRPGLEQARKGLKNDTAAPTFEATGVLDPQTIDTFSQIYKTQADSLHSLGAFNDDSLADGNIGLSTDQSRTPTNQ